MQAGGVAAGSTITCVCRSLHLLLLAYSLVQLCHSSLLLNTLPSFAIWQTFVCDRRLSNCFVGECSGYLGICVHCISLQMYFYINKWRISFTKTQKYKFADLFSSPLIITNSFGKFSIWQTSFRKKPFRTWNTS